MTWYGGTPLGDQYGTVLAWGTDEPPHEPGIHERGLRALVDPMKPGSMTALVNAVTRDVGEDVGGWRVDRLMGMVSQIQAEAEQRQG